MIWSPKHGYESYVLYKKKKMEFMRVHKETWNYTNILVPYVIMFRLDKTKEINYLYNSILINIFFFI